MSLQNILSLQVSYLHKLGAVKTQQNIHMANLL